jgi:cytoskeletal protein CcmA (bactofilin family)
VFKHEIAADTAISGKIHFPGDARIDGRLRGEVRADALLVVGQSGVLQANVNADRLILLGTLQGDAVRARVVELHRGSRLVGNVEAEHLIVHPGAVLEGRCEIGGKYEQAPATVNVILLERPVRARG